MALVGGGPGDPGLISVRGRRLLAEADVVLVDRLAPRALVDELEPEVLVVDVGKTAGHHPLPQEEINRLLVEHARAGRRVVRLKGGDPFVLGRGGEEALACVAAGVAVEVVPGVTSAVSVPAAAGIPVTHRGRAQQVTIASGHEGLDWSSLAAVEGTLVLLMGVSGLAVAARELVAHGKDAATPVAVVERGFAPDQRTTVGTLATIAELARERDVRPPAVVVDRVRGGPARRLGLTIGSVPAAPPPLIAVAHGSSDPAAADATRTLLAAVAVARPGLTVLPAFLDHEQPGLADAVAAAEAAAPSAPVVVPLLLGAAYHSRVDIPAALSGTSARQADVLGPDPLLLRAWSGGSPRPA